MNFLNNIYFFPTYVFLAIGFYSSYTDIKYRKIKNPVIGWAIASGIFMNSFFLFTPDNQKYFFLDFGIALMIALILWRLNIWAAGDGKFFIFSSIFIHFFTPAHSFKNTPFQIPVVIIVFANAFIAAFVYLFLEAVSVFLRDFIVLWRKKSVSAILTDAVVRIKKPEFVLAQGKILFFYFAALIVFSFLNRYMLSFQFLRENYLVFYLILLCAYSPVKTFLEKIKLRYLALGLFLLVWHSGVDIVDILGNLFKFFIFLGLVRTAINWFIQKRETKTIGPEEIQPSLLLAEEEIAGLPLEQKPKMRFFSDGLTCGQAEELRAYFKSINKTDIKVYNTFAFVPFIFLGAIVTFFLQGKLLNILFFLY